MPVELKTSIPYKVPPHIKRQFYIGSVVVIVYTISAIVGLYYYINLMIHNHKQTLKEESINITAEWLAWRAEKLHKLELEKEHNMTMMDIKFRCGKENTNGTLSNSDTFAILNRYPWTVLLEYKTGKNETVFRCDGVLINEQYILTAAQCLTDSNKINGSLSHVRIGDFNIKSDHDCVQMHAKSVKCAPKIQRIEISSIVIHPLYNSKNNLTTSKHDIGLIRLNEKAKFNDFVQPICIPPPKNTSEEQFDGHDVLIVAGWGYNSTNKESYEYKLTNNSKCENNVEKMLKSDEICAVSQKSDNCDKRVGEGLTKKMNDINQWFVVGVSTQIFSCSDSHDSFVPSIFTRVQPYAEWIQSFLK